MNTSFYKGLDPLLIASGQYKGPDLPPPLSRGRIFADYGTMVRHSANEILQLRSEVPGRIMVNIGGTQNAGKSTLTRNLMELLPSMGLEDIIHFSEDFSLQPMNEVFGWERSDPSKFEDVRGSWFRWPVVHEFLEYFTDPATTTFNIRDVLNRDDNVTLTDRTFNLTDNTVLLYDGVFGFDTNHYPKGFDHSVFLYTGFETAIQRSLSKGRERVREIHGKCFIPSHISYRAEYDPQTKANTVIDTNDFARLQMLIYR